MRPRLVLSALATGAAAAAALPLVLASPASAAEQATVSVFHGVPGLTVDVYANGKEIVPNFEPGTLTDPLKLPAGTYDLAVFKDGEGPSGTPAIQAADVKVPAGANVTVAAHLDAAGKPVLTPFVNDTSKIDAGKARITVRHTAAAPAVDVRANGEVAFKDLTNPNEAKADLPAGTISADVVLAGTDTVAIGPADVNLKEGTNTIVYAWGSAADKNLKLAVQTVSGMHSAPGGVPAGGGTGSTDAARYALIAGSAAVAGGLVLTVRRRATARA